MLTQKKLAPRAYSAACVMAVLMFLGLSPARLGDARAQTSGRSRVGRGGAGGRAARVPQTPARRGDRRFGIHADPTSVVFRLDSAAARYAPIVYHQKNEVNWPVNVGWMTARTSLWLYVKNRCNVMLMAGSEGAVPGHTPADATRLEDYMTSWGSRYVYVPQCGPEGTNIDFYNAADRDRNRTFYLHTFGTAGRGGIGPVGNTSASPAWTTYVHEYRNEDGGTTIQYWRVYSYQDYLPDFGGKHGGDWEGVQVVLDTSGVPREVRFLGHGGLDPTYPEIKRILRPGGWDPNGRWGSLQWRDGHPLVSSQRGGHASKEMTDNPADFIEQKTWLYEHGGLEDMGSFEYPTARWVAYSGLWGSPPDIVLPGQPVHHDDPDSSKGAYWGPAFNGNKEADRVVDGVAGKYLTAWCGGAGENELNADDETPEECHLKKPRLIGSYPDN
jgi:hypothetical protein